MTINDYYGHKAGTTFLEIFTITDDDSKKVIHRQLKDQEAYDTWHLSFYFKEILEYKKLLEKNSLTFDDIPRKEKCLLLYMMMGADNSLNSVLELGSSLFEMIDGFELVDYYRNKNNSALPEIDIRSKKYVGIELSEMFRLSTPLLHPGYTIEQYENVDSFSGKKVDIIYDRSVSNYAFETSADFAQFAKQGRVALLNTYFSFEDTFFSSRLGKSLTYFSRDEFLASLGRPVYHLFGRRAPGPFSGEDLSQGRPVVEGFFLVADDQEYVDRFMALANTDPCIRAYFDEKEIKPTPLSELSPR